ncbi:1-(5-phosphoribosyl)-5-[(5-phosphoribosylamino)methylideneamino] imidazole-4-carboxamide isomerase domain protein [Catenibacterium mitsuokai DSM 15897]|nr:1-(5-phosphoribosyl)-5-[(5-phosphoribosylamino)methylideneamino] imidazole-4-carboxamide isomerase domain protein [Catenibacterium mitsuokai DSM 15897]
MAGWTQDSGVRLEPLLERYAAAGLRHLLCTDVSRDGTMAGPNLDLYKHIREIAPDVQLQASGGIRDIADIVAADSIGCSGAVLGKALIEGRFQLTDALKQVRRC